MGLNGGGTIVYQSIGTVTQNELVGVNFALGGATGNGVVPATGLDVILAAGTGANPGTWTVLDTLDETDFTLPGSGARSTYSLTLDSGTSVADGQTLFLAFQNTSGANNPVERLLLDDVSVAAVPEPGSTALLGLGGLTLILRRRK